MNKGLYIAALTCALAASALGVSSWGGVAPWQWNDDDVNCASDAFDSAAWRRDVSSLGGQVERRGILTTNQWQARVFVKCTRPTGTSKRELAKILGAPDADDGGWDFSLGERQGAFRSGAESLDIYFGPDDRVERLEISRVRSDD